jgi:putative ABC transport system permease protein
MFSLYRIGEAIRLDGETLTVIGILPADFRFPSANTALWRPTDLTTRPDASGWNKTAEAYVRFAPGVPREDALRLATEASYAADSSTARLRPWVYPLVDRLDPYSNRAVPLLAGGVVLVFVVLCTNVCSLLLARLTARRREFSMRAALGASPDQIRRVVLRDGLLVATTGLAIGSLLAATLARGLASLQYGVTPYDPLSWAIVLGLIALTALGACWGPARAAARLDPQLLLREE